MEKLPCNIVYITEKPVSLESVSLSTDTLEINTPQATRQTLIALSSICNQVTCYEEIGDFCSNLAKHQNDLVFTTVYGRAAPSSKALVPAICEANHIRYVGADSYTQMLCNDKYLSKRYAKGYGIEGAKDVIIRRPDCEEELAALASLRFPVIVKPNFGGASTGISKANVKHTLGETLEFAKELYAYHRLPVLVEEYIPGYEVELILLGNSHEMKLCHEVQLIIEGETYYNNTIWGYETKRINDEGVSFFSSHHFQQDDIRRLVRLFQSFNKVEYMRIDCRTNEQGMKLIELSPDCYLGEDCAFYYAFAQHSHSFEDMIYALVKNSLASQGGSMGYPLC